MKKLFLLVALVAAAFISKAQEITIGPKVGMNVTNISNIDDSKNKVSIHVGAFAEWKVNDFFAIQPEVVYSRQGFRYKENGTKIKNRVNYLNIPVLAKLYVLENLSVDLGPQLGLALNGKAVAKNNGDTHKYKNKDLNTVEFSWAIGLSYNWDRFMFSARYNIGLSNVMDKDKSWDKSNNKNHVFQLSVGYRFSDLF